MKALICKTKQIIYNAIMHKPNTWQHLYGTTQWKQLRIITFVRDKYICQICSKPVNQHHKHHHAAICDHITPHKGDIDLFYDPDNLQTVGKSCHDSDKQRIEAGRQPKPVIAVDGWPAN